MKNFHVDDPLKSVETEDSEIQLIKFVNLTKFLTEKVFLSQFQKIIERIVSRTKILMESYQKKGH